MATLKMYDLAGKNREVRYSPYCWRIRMAVAHKGLELETIAWDPSQSEALAFSGQAQVPVLVDGESVVHDSWQIAEYLDRTYPDRPALFDGEQGRALTRFHKVWTESMLHPALFALSAGDIVDTFAEAARDGFRQRIQARRGLTPEEIAALPIEPKREGLEKAIAPLAATLNDQPYLAGQEPAFADYIVFGAFQWIWCCSEIPVVPNDGPVHDWWTQLQGRFDGLAAKAIRRVG